LEEIKDRNIPIHLIVTSPPYPMIAMWDKQFSELGANSYEKMHELLSKVWKQSFDVLVDGGLMCINIGDAIYPYPKSRQKLQAFKVDSSPCTSAGVR